MATNLEDLLGDNDNSEVFGGELSYLMDLRRRLQAKEPVSRDELRQAITYLRQGRASAAMGPKKGGKKAKGAVTNVDLSKLFGDL